MPGKPVVLETRSFKSRLEAKAFFRAMLKRYSMKERISDMDSKDLMSLIKRHSQYQEKVGAGISHFETMPDGYGKKCFRLVRVDGSGIDISFVHSVDMKD